MIEMEEDGIDAKFKQIFEYIQHGMYIYIYIYIYIYKSIQTVTFYF